MQGYNDEGVCPSCEGRGPLGAACPERVCTRKSYHYVPGEYVAGGRELDPMIGRSIDEYLIVSMLGAGGFGKVFLALQQPIQLKAALKLMHGHLAQSDMARRMLDKFYGEARALAQLTHPNIVRLLKFGVLGDAPYMVMEFVEGGRTLLEEMQERLTSGRELAAADVRAILGQVVDGLEAAHRRGIVHRDIKPENIMLQQVAGNPWFVRVLDFGLAKDLAQGSSTSVAMGTPMYMAPEQLERTNIGPWTDWYAVGTMAFELMTGRRPFHGHTHSELLRSKLDPSYDPLTRVSDIVLPGPVQAFFKKALHRSPEQRYREAAAFRAGMMAAVEAIASDASLQLQSIALGGIVEVSDVPVPAVEATLPRDAASAEIAAAQARLERERQALEAQRRALESERQQLRESRQQAPPPAWTGPAGDESFSPPARSSKGLVWAALGVAVAAAAVGLYLAFSGGAGLPDAPEPAKLVAVEQTPEAPEPAEPEPEPEPEPEGASKVAEDKGEAATVVSDEARELQRPPTTGHEVPGDDAKAPEAARAEAKQIEPAKTSRSKKRGKDKAGSAVGVASASKSGIGDADSLLAALEKNSKKTSKNKSRVSTGNPAVAGSLDKNIVRRVIRQHLRATKRCYEKELQKNPKLAGKLTVSFVIGASGNVQTARVTSDSLGSAAVSSCVARVFKQMRFPAPRGGGIVSISYPLVFKSG